MRAIVAQEEPLSGPQAPPAGFQAEDMGQAAEVRLGVNLSIHEQGALVELYDLAWEADDAL
jgi:hypothetical protein